MREIVLDTETTGLDPSQGHRIVEIGCVELINHVPTGKEYHTYIDPERDMPAEAEQIHGITAAMLEGKPKFGEIAADFLAFIGESKLVIHNAAFDIKFLNAELDLIGQDPLPISRAVDTLLIAQQRFPGAQASLDALCRRFNIDLTARDKHGALIDCHLLAQVYLELAGGRQPGLELAADSEEDEIVVPAQERPRREPRAHLTTGLLTDEERARHEAFVEKLNQPLWRQ